MSETAGRGRSQEPWYHWRNLVAGIAVVLVLSALLLGLVFLWRIVLAPIYIGAPATESQALTRANERIIQMFQWMISTILLMGGALVGLNWYQSNQRYERDKEDLDRRVTHLEQIEERVRGYLDDIRTTTTEFGYKIESFDANRSKITNGSPETEQTDTTEASQKSRSLIASFLDNVYSRDALPPFQRYTDRYLTPNPFTDAAPQKKEAVAAIISMLESAKSDGVVGEALIQQGVSHVSRLLPLLTAEDPESAAQIRSLLTDLGFGPLADGG